MAMRPNYNQQRGDRQRAKDAKRLEKVQRREEAAQDRKVQRDPIVPAPAPSTDKPTKA